MAIAVLKAPTGNTPIEELEWGLQLSDAGTPPIVKRLAYQLFEVAGGTAVTERRSVDYSASGVYIHFGKIIQTYLSTPLPDTNLTDAATMAKEFYLEYGELHYNEDDNTTTEVGFTQTSNVKAINATTQVHAADFPSNTTQPTFLSLKPDTLFLCRNQQDYIYVMTGSQGISIDANRYDQAGNLLVEPPDPIATIAANEIKAVGIGWENGIVVTADNMVRIELTFRRSSTVDKTINLYFGNCKCKAQVMFQEPIGGYSVLGFDEIEFRTTRQVDTYEEYAPILSYDLRTRQHGLHATNGKGFVNVVLKKTFKRHIKADEREYLEGFITSQSHFLKYTGPSPHEDDTWLKVIVQNSELVTRREGKVEWTINARLHRNMRVLPSEL